MELRFGIPFPLDDIVLVGTGGTGSHLAPNLVRLAYIQKTLIGQAPNIFFVEDDEVELRNINRQNFFNYEIGVNKATALAQRLMDQFEIPIDAIESRLLDTIDMGIEYIWPSVHASFLDARNVLIVSTTDSRSFRTRMSELLHTHKTLSTQIGVVDDTYIVHNVTNMINDNTLFRYIIQKRPVAATMHPFLSILDKLIKADTPAENKLMLQLLFNEYPVVNGNVNINDIVKSIEKVDPALKKRIQGQGASSGYPTVQSIKRFAENGAKAFNIVWVDAGNAKESGQTVIASTAPMGNLIYANTLLPLFDNDVMKFYSARSDVNDAALIKRLATTENIEKYLNSVIDVTDYTSQTAMLNPVLRDVATLFPESYYFDQMAEPIIDEINLDTIGNCTLNAIEEPQILPINIAMATSLVQAIFGMTFGTINYQAELVNIFGNWKKIPIGSSVDSIDKDTQKLIAEKMKAKAGGINAKNSRAVPNPSGEESTTDL